MGLMRLKVDFSTEGPRIISKRNLAVRLKRYDEISAPIFFTFYLNGSSERLHQVFADCQPETNTSLILLLGSIELPEVLEQLAFILILDTDSCVPHR